MEKWIQLIEEYMGGGTKLRPAVKVGVGDFEGDRW